MSFDKGKTLVVNLLGGPSAGKSTIAHGLMFELKLLQINCEFAPEYAKGAVFEGATEKLDNQDYIFGKQLQWISRYNGKTQVIVTDAPLLHSIIYDSSQDENFRQNVLNKHKRFNNLNVLVERFHEYNPSGRLQTEEGAGVIHDSIVALINSANLKDDSFIKTSCTRENIFKLGTLIKEQIQNI